MVKAQKLPGDIRKEGGAFDEFIERQESGVVKHEDDVSHSKS